MNKTDKYFSAYFNDETDLKSAVKKLKDKNAPIRDVFTPFPVHGLDQLLGYRRSHIPKVGFWGGLIGALAGFGFQAWVFTKAWPLNIGGKPYLSIPSFIPVTFECTVLFAAFAMVFAFLFRSNLGLGAKNKIYDEQVTNDRFLIILDADKTEYENKMNEFKEILINSGAKDFNVNN